MRPHVRRSKMIKYPQPIKFHKKVAQLQLDLKRPEQKEEGGRTKITTGCVFFTLARALDDGSDRMDWDNKILMKIDVPDIAKLVAGVRTGKFPVDIFHTTGDKSSTLKIEPGQNNGTFKLSMGKKGEGANKFASIYLNNEDMYAMFNLLEAAVPVILGWI